MENPSRRTVAEDMKSEKKKTGRRSRPYQERGASLERGCSPPLAQGVPRATTRVSGCRRRPERNATSPPHPFFSWIAATRVRHRQWVPLMAWGRTYDRSPFRPKQYGPHDTPTGHPLSDTGFDFAKHPATIFFPGNHSDLLLLD